MSQLEAYIEKMARSPIEFGRYMFVDEKGVRAMDEDTPLMHREIERHLLNYDLKMLNLVAPRGTAKSTLVAVCFALWHCFLERTHRRQKGLFTSNRQKFVLIVSKTDRSAGQRMGAIKAILGDKTPGGEVYSKPFRAIFGNWGYQTARKWQETEIILKDGTVIKSTSMGSQIHGLNVLGVRPTLIILDDPEDENNTKTPEAIAKNRRVFLGGLVPALDFKEGRIITIGTPICQGCLIDILHDIWGNTDQAFSMWFRQKVNEEESMHSVGPEVELPHTEEERRRIVEDVAGRWLVYPHLLWPSFQTKERLEQLRNTFKADRELGPGAFTRAFECYMASEEEKRFHPEWFERQWEGEVLRDDYGEAFLKLRRRGDEVFDEPLILHVGITAGYDPAYTVNAWSSNTAGSVIATDKDDNRYELDFLYEKYLPNEMLMRYKEMQDRNRPGRSMSEANGPQIAAWQRMVEYGIYAMPDKQAQERSKKERIEMLQNPMSQGKYYFLPGTPALKDGISFPRGSMDYLDAMEKADRIRLRGMEDMKYIDPNDRKARARTKRHMSAMTV